MALYAKVNLASSFGSYTEGQEIPAGEVPDDVLEAWTEAGAVTTSAPLPPEPGRGLVFATAEASPPEKAVGSGRRARR